MNAELGIRNSESDALAGVPGSLATVELIGLAREEAVAALAKYRAAISQSGAHPWAGEDAAIMAGYRALAQGRPLLDLEEAMRAGGAHGDGLPRFAVCRADARRCYVEVATNGSVTFSPRNEFWGSRRYSLLNRPHFPAGTLPRPPQSWLRGETLVPMVPAPLRPRAALSGYLTLWEVEKWLPLPPRDPFLLKWLGSGCLCAVVAMWNLTPLERAAMRGAIVR